VRTKGYYLARYSCSTIVYELRGEEDVEVRDKSLLTSFSIDGEYTSDTL
jgi:hypothetical protein